MISRIGVRYAAALTLAGGLVLAAPGIALAGTQGSSSPNASTPGHFSYTDAYFNIPVQCNEVHHPGDIPSGLLNQTPVLQQTTGGYDTVDCQFATPDTAQAGQTFVLPAPWVWFSDFGSTFDQNVGQIRISVNGSGTGYHGVATYPNG